MKERLLGDVKDAMNVRIRDNVRYLMQAPYSQADFVKFCKEEWHIEVNQGNFSTYLNGPKTTTISLPLLTLLSEYLKVDMKKLMWDNLSVGDKIVRDLEREMSMKDGNLIFDVENPLFNQYLGEYECCFYSTISKEDKLLYGTMKLEADFTSHLCRVKVLIDTGTLKEETGKPYYKLYKGIMCIFRNTNVCACLVGNDEIGELNYISFRLKSNLNNRKNIGGMAAVCTVSAGADTVPTMHRMLLRRQPVNTPISKELEANLRLNTSRILIREDELESFFNLYPITDKAKKLITDSYEKASYCEIKEGILRSINKKDLNGMENSQFIALLRSFAYAERFNKISQKLDEHVVKLIEEDKKHPRKHLKEQKGTT